MASKNYTFADKSSPGISSTRFGYSRTPSSSCSNPTVYFVTNSRFTQPRGQQVNDADHKRDIRSNSQLEVQISALPYRRCPARGGDNDSRTMLLLRCQGKNLRMFFHEEPVVAKTLGRIG